MRGHARDTQKRCARNTRMTRDDTQHCGTACGRHVKQRTRQRAIYVREQHDNEYITRETTRQRAEQRADTRYGTLTKHENSARGQRERRTNQHKPARDQQPTPHDKRADHT